MLRRDAASSWVRISAGRWTVSVDVPHLVLLASLAGFCGAYLADARAASTDVQNLLLIEPAACLGLVFAAAILVSAIRISAQPAPALPVREPLPASTLVKVLGCMLLLGGYVAAMAFLGFDAATVLYVGGSLWVLGERRPAVLIGVSLAFGVIATQLFRYAVSVPFPMLLPLA